MVTALRALTPVAGRWLVPVVTTAWAAPTSAVGRWLAPVAITV
uniref:Uncharacterized protein n=1 Tax=Nonomuraea gerenzanensis TaxID=93944 RepID=A0A1M4E753_9ACTN|nr:hypothetical protein BN4615_P4213 [Nonomuraea gerenzanensis]